MARPVATDQRQAGLSLDPIRTELNPFQVIQMRQTIGHRLSGLSVPDARAEIFRSRHHPPAIRAEARLDDFAIVSEWRRDWLAGAGIPHPRRAISRRSRHLFAVGTEHCCPNNIAVPKRSDDSSPGFGVVDLSSAIG